VPKKGDRKLWAFAEASDPGGMVALMRLYIEALKVKNLSPRTTDKYEWELSYFILWCHERDLVRPEDVTRPVLERYQRFLYYYRTKAGRPLSFRSQYKKLAAPKYFFRWLARHGYLPHNPASDLDMPKLGKRLPRNILTAQEAEQVLSQPDLSTPFGVRDRAILETFYSTGIRRGELVRLKLYDVGFERGTLMIREGKGQKDRVIPIGERALFWIQKYLSEARPQLVVPPDEGFIFLTYLGVPFHPDYLGHEVKKYIASSGVGKEGACHIFRHTMATLMLDGGADIRYVQEMLGHTKLETTSIYTQVTIDKLKKIHDATHPGAKLKPAALGEEAEEGERRLVDEDPPDRRG
jgi:integrase/recombinase XerD